MSTSKKPRKTNPYGSKTKQGVGSKPKAAASDQNIGCFFMAAALCIYDKGEGVRQRHINVLFQNDEPNVTKEGLNTMHKTAMQRLNQENGVMPEHIADIVFLGISFLGAMPVEEFHGMHNPEVDGPTN